MKELLQHIEQSPLGWHEGKIVMHRSTTEDDVVAWLMRLKELARKCEAQR